MWIHLPFSETNNFTGQYTECYRGKTVSRYNEITRTKIQNVISICCVKMIYFMPVFTSTLHTQLLVGNANYNIIII